MANWNKKNTGRPDLADNARASIELIADRLDNLEKGLSGDESITEIDINGGTIDGTPINGGTINGTPIGALTPSTGRFTTIGATGDITSGGDYDFSSAKTKIASVNGASFVLQTQGANFSTKPSIDNGILFGEPFNGQNLNLSFSLDCVPNGATITNITFYQHSSSGDTYSFRGYLYRLTLADKTSTAVDDTEEVSVSGTNMNSSAVLDAGVTVDYSTYIYSLRLFLSNFNGNEYFYIYGAKITYTINNL